MVEQQTQENLKRVIEEEMEIFGLDYKQILAVTHDNGANMLAAVRCMKRMMGKATEEFLASMLPRENALLCSTPADSESDSDSEEVDIDENEIKVLPENDDFTENYTKPKCGDAAPDDDHIDLDLLESVRCGAHTAQLAVWDVLRDYKTRLSNINQKCQKMHRKANRKHFTFHKTAFPPENLRNAMEHMVHPSEVFEKAGRDTVSRHT